MRPKMKKTLAMYSDIQKVLDAALAARGGTFRTGSHGTAVHWRQRAYQFRKLYRDTVNEQNSPYDRLSLRKVEPESSEIIIHIIETPGEFTPANKEEVVVVGTGVREDDPLLSEALEFARDIL